MKTLLGLGVGVALLAGMMLAGGCVSRSDYDEALAAARGANDVRDAAQEALEKLKKDRDALMAELANRQAVIDADAQKLAMLQQAL